MLIHGIGDSRAGDGPRALGALLNERRSCRHFRSRILELHWNSEDLHPIPRLLGNPLLPYKQLWGAGLFEGAVMLRLQELTIQQLSLATTLLAFGNRREARSVGLLSSLLLILFLTIAATSTILLLQGYLFFWNANEPNATAANVYLIRGLHSTSIVDTAVVASGLLFAASLAAATEAMSVCKGAGINSRNGLRSVIMALLFPLPVGAATLCVGLMLAGQLLLVFGVLIAFPGVIAFITEEHLRQQGLGFVGMMGLMILGCIGVGSVLFNIGGRAIRGPVKLYADVMRYVADVEHRRRLYRALDSVVSQLEDEERAILVGHSLGSVIAADWLRRHGDPRMRDRVDALLTYGSPLRRYFASWFQDRYGDMRRLIPEVLRIRPKLLWRNVYHRLDYVGGAIFGRGGNDRLRDVRLREHWRPHTGYLRQRAFGVTLLRLLHRVWAESSTSALSAEAIRAPTAPPHAEMAEQQPTEMILFGDGWWWRHREAVLQAIVLSWLIVHIALGLGGYWRTLPGSKYFEERIVEGAPEIFKMLGLAFGIWMLTRATIVPLWGLSVTKIDVPEGVVPPDHDPN